MTAPRFLQFHTLHSYPAALLNRDDSGLAKRLPFGGAVRTRVSSQCLKRHWRTAEDEFSLRNIDATGHSVRSRDVVSRRVMDGIENVAGDVLDAVEEVFQRGVYGEKATSRQARQPLLLGLPEVEYLREQAVQVCAAHPHDAEAAAAAAQAVFGTGRGDRQRENFRAFRESARMPGGLIGALFGRMVTSDPAANIDAAVHVAHAFTVHAEESENDYFTVVDDLHAEDAEPGAAHIGDMELTAGLFYGYVVVDVPGLVSNVEGCPADQWESSDRELASRVVEHLTHLIATVSPGAKLGSTAPYAYADLMLVEAGARQPRSLANAFRDPVAASTAAAVAAMADRLDALDAAYGPHEARRMMSVEPGELPRTKRLDLDGLAGWAAGAVRDAEAA